MSLDELIKVTPGGPELLQEYNETNGLSSVNRRKLVNIAVDSMISKYGYCPSTDQKVDCAKEIVQCFPKLKDPGSEEGYEIFYDPDTRSGYISWRLKTINRKKKGEKKRVHCPKVSNVRAEAVESHSQEGINEDPLIEQMSMHDLQRIEFLKSACQFTQRQEIIAAMNATFDLRTNFPKQILDYFPRFVDIPYLIDLDFALMFPGISCRPINTELIFKAAEILLPRNSNVKTNKETEWDTITRAYITLMKLMPPSTKARKKVEREVLQTDKLVTFQEVRTSLNNVPIANKHPYLVAVGKSRNAISAYYIAMKGKLFATEATDFQTAFDQLFKTHFVFYAKYEETLSAFYQFVQSFYYGIQAGVTFTPRMREIRSYLSQEE